MDLFKASAKVGHDTHRPHLMSILDKLIKSEQLVHVLEIGVGEGSGEVFSEYSKKHENIRILGLESNKIWLDATRERYETNNYHFKLANWTRLDDLELAKHYSLIFIDSAPYGSRIQAFKYLQDRFEYCMIHDWDWMIRRRNDFVMEVNSLFHVTHFLPMEGAFPSTTALIRKKIKIF